MEPAPNSSESSSDPPIPKVDKRELPILTPQPKMWDFTCTFCFKSFPSAQSLGGHQNAHRAERMKEKILHVKNLIGYRKRAYLGSVSSLISEPPSGRRSKLDLLVGATAKPKAEAGLSLGRVRPQCGRGAGPARVGMMADGNNGNYAKYMKPSLDLNLPPPLDFTDETVSAAKANRQELDLSLKL